MVSEQTVVGAMSGIKASSSIKVVRVVVLNSLDGRVRIEPIKTTSISDSITAAAMHFDLFEQLLFGFGWSSSCSSFTGLTCCMFGFSYSFTGSTGSAGLIASTS